VMGGEASAPMGGRLIAAALDQVIENALSYAPAGSVVTVTLHRGSRQALIAVADGGPGVDPALLPHIFQRHASFRDQGRQDASLPNFGLGLWVARRNVEAVGGSIQAANRPGGGFIVTLSLPLG
jgi:two-component system sensor histidine kinase ChvG